MFFPIQGLVHHGNIATVTKQRAFNKAMITPFTEVIFIDEADEKTLDVADWKILTQGGYTAHDVKYQTAKAFLNKCPMLVLRSVSLILVPPTSQQWIDVCARISSRASRIPNERRQRGSKSTPWNALFGLLKRQKHVTTTARTKPIPRATMTTT